jgi:NTP pyrophosphatase (non-canonical NTP hydrolase)
MHFLNFSKVFLIQNLEKIRKTHSEVFAKAKKKNQKMHSKIFIQKQERKIGDIKKQEGWGQKFSLVSLLSMGLSLAKPF